MDKKSKLLLWLMFFLLVSSVAATYWRTMIKRNYLVTAQIGCDPETEVCFISVCDSETEECSDNPKEDTLYYKLITKNASRIPECDPAGEGCLEVKCEAGELDCEETLCNPESLGEEEECSNPEEYSASLLFEEEEILREVEESVACDPEDSDCVPEETEENLEVE